jgi:hypothetical protein
MSNRQKHVQADAFRHGELLPLDLSDYLLQLSLERLLSFEQDFLLRIATGRFTSREDCLKWEVVGLVKKEVIKAGNRAMKARRKQSRLKLTITQWKLLRYLPHKPDTGVLGQDEWKNFAETGLDYMIDQILQKSVNQCQYYALETQ